MFFVCIQSRYACSSAAAVTSFCAVSWRGRFVALATASTVTSRCGGRGCCGLLGFLLVLEVAELDHRAGAGESLLRALLGELGLGAFGGLAGCVGLGCLPASHAAARWRFRWL
jgi:hypothetical protein